MSLGKKLARWILGAAVAAAAPFAFPAAASAQAVADVQQAPNAQQLRADLDAAQFQLDRALADVDTARSTLNAARQRLTEIEAQLAGAQRALDAASGPKGDDQQRLAA